MAERRENDFSKGSVKRLIIAQAVPLTLAQAVHLLYNVVDRIYIGHLAENGSMALTGLGITFPVIVLIAAFTGMFGTGGATMFALARGRGDGDEAERILGNVFALLGISALLLTIFCYGFRRPILFLFGASEQSYLYADEYLKIYLLGTAFSMFATGLNGYINAQGFPRTGMLTIVIGAVINIVLDPLFIFVMGMGVRGAAIATVISQAISAAWVLKFLTGRRAILRLKASCMRICPVRTRRIVALGIPSFVMQGTNSLVQIVCNNQLQAFGGDLYVGILTVIGSVREMISLPLNGIGGGAQPILGYNYGAGKGERVKEGIRFMSLLGCGYTLLAWIAIMLFPRQLMGIFTSDAEAIRVGARMMNIYFFGFLFMALQFVGQNSFQALGKAKQAVFFSLLRKAILVVPLTLLLPGMGFGVEGVFLAEPISNVLGGCAAFFTMWAMVYRRL